MKPLITILVPVFNEERVIPLFFNRIRPVIDTLSSEFDSNLVFINNASSDGSRLAVEQIRAEFSNVFLLTLSKNVGYQRSLEFGLRNTFGDLFVFIDVDCEDPPEMILDFIRLHKEGNDIVYGERVDREEPEGMKLLRKLFYRITHAIADDEVVLDMAEFSLMTREVRDAIVQDSSSFPFIRASIGRVGFRRVGIPYRRHRRIAGETHYNILGMTTFAIGGILSSSTLFLRLPIYLLPPWLITLTVLTYLASDVASTTWAMPALIFSGFIYPGTILAISSIYLARIYKNTLGRPNAIIDTRHSFPQAKPDR